MLQTRLADSRLQQRTLGDCSCVPDRSLAEAAVLLCASPGSCHRHSLTAGQETTAQLAIQPSGVASHNPHPHVYGSACEVVRVQGTHGVHVSGCAIDVVMVQGTHRGAEAAAGGGAGPSRQGQGPAGRAGRQAVLCGGQAGSARHPPKGAAAGAPSMPELSDALSRRSLARPCLPVIQVLPDRQYQPHN